MANRKTCGSTERVLRPVIKGSSLARGAEAISVGSFSHQATAKSMVCIPAYNASLPDDYRALKRTYPIAHSLPHGAGRLHPRNAHILRPRPHPGYPAADLTTTSLNSHVICTDPQLLIEERPEAYKSIQAVVDDVEEKRIAEGVCVLRPFVTYKAGDPTGSGLSAREREREKAARTTGLGSGPIGKSMAENPDDEA
jgi:hypothetical protein